MMIVYESEVRSLTIDATAPTISANANETILYAEGDNILLNTTITDTNLDECWYEV